MKLSKVLPIDEISDDYYITSFDTITFGYKMVMPEVYTLGEIEAEAFFVGYRSALDKLGTDVVVQKYGMFYSKKYENTYSGKSITREWNERSFEGRDVMYCDHYIFISFYFGSKNLASTKNLYKNRSLLEILDRKYSKLSGENIYEYYKRLGSFEISMGYDRERKVQTDGLCEEFTPLSGSEMLHFVEKYLSSDYGDSLVDKDYASIDLRSGLTIGNKSLSVLSMRRMPTVISGFDRRNGVVTSDASHFKSGIKLKSSYLFPIAMGLPLDHIVCETMVLLHNEKVEYVLNKELKDLRFLLGLGRNDAINKKDIINHYLEMTPAMDLNSCKYGLCIIVPHSKYDKIKVTTNVQKIASDVMDMQLYVENRNELNAFINNLPGCGHVINDLRIGWREVLALSTHMESYKNGNRYGVQFVDMFGKPFIFDFWDESNRYLKARNGQIYAPTGEGKSFLTNLLLDQCFNLGDSIFIIDVDGSYKRTTELNMGDYFDSKNLKTFAFNPFMQAYHVNGKWYPNKTSDGSSEGEDDVSHVIFLTTIILSIWYAPDDANPNAVVMHRNLPDLIKASINSFYSYVNNTKGVVVNFSNYCKYVIDIHYNELDPAWKEHFDILSFKMTFESFMENGDYGFLLNAEKPINVDNRWVCFDLVGISAHKQISPVVTLLVMNLFQKKMDSLNGKRIRFFMDEAIDFIKEKVFGNYIGALYRKIRKRNGQVFIITQNISFILGTDELVQRSIFGNSSIRIALDHSSSESSIPLLQKHWGLTDSETELLRNMKVDKNSNWRLVFIKFGTMPAFLVRNEVSAQTFAAYNTDRDKVEEINEITTRTGSLNSGIETYVENNNNKK